MNLLEVVGLLDDDKEYIKAIKEGYRISFGDSVCCLFVMLLTSNSIARTDHVWNQTWEYMSDDIEHEQHLLFKNLDLEIRERHRKNLCLQYIDKLIHRNGSSLSSISRMYLPDLEFLENYTNTLIHDKICYNPDLLRAEHERLFLSLTAEQKIIYTRVISAVENNKGGVFFLYGYDGTGKTYIWKTLSAAIRSKREIVLNVASSGIAPLLLTGGRTAHSRFRIPINVNEDSFCSITAGIDLAALLIKTSLIIWDEDPMMHRYCFKALDRSLRDIIGSTNPRAKDMLFGGKVIVFRGDFRLREGFDKSNIEEIKKIRDWILKMGDGRLGGPNNGEMKIDIPNDILISDNRAILAPTHEVIGVINDRLLSQIPGEEVVYCSSDSICESEGVDNTYTESLYSPEVLNGLKLSGIPNHRLALKVGAPVMLVQNINQTASLCNGTRLRILKLGEHVFEAQIMTSTNVHHTTIIPRLKLSPSDKRLPLKINRRQFSLAVCFAMTINKSQGQSLSNVGLFFA
ncbi:ATP-dependent DNA helicase PIF1-like protein [Tanacetum coccineum]